MSLLLCVVVFTGGLVLAYKIGHNHGVEQGFRAATDEVLQMTAGTLGFLKVQDLSGLEDEESTRISTRNKTLDEIYHHLQRLRTQLLADYDKHGLPDEP